MDRQLAFPLELPRPALGLAAMCSDEERLVASLLRWGREGAMQISEISELAGIPARRVQELIEHLIHEHQVPVGTAMSRPFGNYLIDDPEDLAATDALLRMRGISNLKRAAALRQMSFRRYLAEVQLELDQGGS